MSSTIIASKVSGIAPSNIKTISEVLTPLTTKTPRPAAPTAADKFAALIFKTKAVLIPPRITFKSKVAQQGLMMDLSQASKEIMFILL